MQYKRGGRGSSYADPDYISSDPDRGLALYIKCETLYRIQFWLKYTERTTLEFGKGSHQKRGRIQFRIRNTECRQAVESGKLEPHCKSGTKSHSIHTVKMR
jgi:hypothetical protein